MDPVTFENVKKSTLENSSGVRYTQYKATLTPKYSVVWFHIGIGYFFFVVHPLSCGFRSKNLGALVLDINSTGGIISGSLD